MIGRSRRVRKFIRCALRVPSRKPREIQIEVTNRCNLSCMMCPRNHMDLPVKDMSYQVFEEVVSKIPGADTIILTGWGEPLLHPDFFKMVAFVNERLPETGVRFTTNGFLLDSEVRKRIFEHRIAQVAVSIDELLEAGGEEGVVHSSADSVLENLMRLIQERGDDGLPKVCLQSVMQRDGLEKIKGLIGFGAEIGVDFINLVRLDIGGNPDLARPTREEEREVIREAKHLGKDMNIRLFCINDQNLAMRIAGHFDKYCLRVDDYVYIDVDGNVTPCCNLRRYRCGSLLEGSLSEIWANDRSRMFRRNLSEICKGCDALTYGYKSW